MADFELKTGIPYYAKLELLECNFNDGEGYDCCADLLDREWGPIASLLETDAGEFSILVNIGVREDLAKFMYGVSLTDLVESFLSENISGKPSDLSDYLMRLANKIDSKDEVQK